MTIKVPDFVGPAAMQSLAALLPTALRSTGENHLYILSNLLEMVVEPLLASGGVLTVVEG